MDWAGGVRRFFSRRRSSSFPPTAAPPPPAPPLPPAEHLHTFHMDGREVGEALEPHVSEAQRRAKMLRGYEDKMLRPSDDKDRGCAA
jgi:hypothetical protein